MCRPDHGDPLTSALTVPDFVAEASSGVKGLKIAVSATLGYAHSTPLPLGPLESAARALSEAGAQVEKVDPPVWNIRRAYVTVCEVAFAAAAADLPAERMALLDPGLIETARRGMLTSAVHERQAQVERVRLMRAFAKFFGEYDLLLTPCVRIAPFTAGHGIKTPDASSYPEWYDWTPYTWVFNAAKLPAASCPWGLDATRLPEACNWQRRTFARILCYEQALCSKGPCRIRAPMRSCGADSRSTASKTKRTSWKPRTFAISPVPIFEDLAEVDRPWNPIVTEIHCSIGGS